MYARGVAVAVVGGCGRREIKQCVDGMKSIPVSVIWHHDINHNSIVNTDMQHERAIRCLCICDNKSIDKDTVFPTSSMGTP